jgi:hypothetical protein
MTVKTVIGEVCAFVGVRPPTSLMVLPSQDRTAWEMVQLATEMAQRIAYNTRDWQLLYKKATLTGDWVVDPDGDPPTLTGKKEFLLPADWQRMLLTANVYRSTNPTVSMTFISDADEWLQHRLQDWTDPYGEWTMMGNKMLVWPPLGGFTPADPPTPSVNPETVQFMYLHKNCITLASGDLGDRFTSDDDTFNLSERLLKLGMIWQWKAYKGGTYAEDIANYEDALAMIAGADKPSPIIVGRMNLSTARRSYPYSTPSASETPYP